MKGFSDERAPRSFTFIFEDKQIHILSVERAIEWWRKQILTKNNDELKNTPENNADDNWIRVEACRISFLIPQNLKRTSREGVDSCIAEFANGKMTLSI